VVGAEYPNSLPRLIKMGAKMPVIIVVSVVMHEISGSYFRMNSLRNIDMGVPSGKTFRNKDPRKFITRKHDPSKLRKGKLYITLDFISW
jgi:hypothetical protein